MIPACVFMVGGTSGRKSSLLSVVGCGTKVAGGINVVVGGTIMVVAGIVVTELGSVTVTAGRVVVPPGRVTVAPGTVTVAPGGVLAVPHPATTRLNIMRGTIRNSDCSLCLANILHLSF